MRRGAPNPAAQTVNSKPPLPGAQHCSTQLSRGLLRTLVGLALDLLSTGSRSRCSRCRALGFSAAGHSCSVWGLRFRVLHFGGWSLVQDDGSVKATAMLVPHIQYRRAMTGPGLQSAWQAPGTKDSLFLLESGETFL